MADELVLDQFYKSAISIQALFDLSNPPMFTVSKNDKLQHYQRGDVAIELEAGNKMISAFRSK